MDHAVGGLRWTGQCGVEFYELTGRLEASFQICQGKIVFWFQSRPSYPWLTEQCIFHVCVGE